MLCALLAGVITIPASYAQALRRPPLPHTASPSLHVPVLEYHRFLPQADARLMASGYDVTPAAFDAQLAALHDAGWHTVTASQLANAVLDQGTLAPKTFVITIDDGYADGYTDALPILRKYGFVATYYVIAGRIGEHRGAESTLDDRQLHALLAAGMEIGNHTMSHVRLATLPPRQQFAQIENASVKLQQFTGVRPGTMAYPFGSYNATTEQVARRAGIRYAFDSHHGATESATDAYASPRLRVGPAMTGAELLALVEQFSH